MKADELRSGRETDRTYREILRRLPDPANSSTNHRDTFAKLPATSRMPQANTSLKLTSVLSVTIAECVFSRKRFAETN